MQGHDKIHKAGWGDASITFFSNVDRLLLAAAIAMNALMVVFCRLQDHCRMSNVTRSRAAPFGVSRDRRVVENPRTSHEKIEQVPVD